MRLKKAWHFLWYNNSALSWLLNLALAFILVKFIIYPVAGIVLATSHPMVAVVSGSMEHSSTFGNWWESNKEFYLQHDITKEDFKKYPFNQGFNKGDIMVLVGTSKISKGDVIVYNSMQQYPIIHRVIGKSITSDGYAYATKGDNNIVQDPVMVDKLIGRAVFRIPFLGYAKIMFTGLVKLFM